MYIQFLTHYKKLLFFCSTVFFTANSSSFALGGVWDDLLRGTTRVADAAPLKNVEIQVSRLSKSPATKNAVAAEIKKTGKVIDKSKAVLELLGSATQKLDPSVLNSLKKLDTESQEVAWVLAKGGKKISETIPDIAARGRLLQEGGLDTVAAVGIYGQEAAEAALRISQAIEGGTLVVKGGQKVTLADFGMVLTQTGSASWTFFKEYVQPYWKTWVGSGAAAAYLINPEAFHDAAGKLTNKGFEHLTTFVGKAAAEAIRGIGNGSGQATRNILDAIKETFFSGNWLSTFLGTGVFIGCISLFFKRIRYYFFWPFRWLNTLPDEIKIPK